MASSMSNATAVATYADYYNKLNQLANSPAAHMPEVMALINGIAADVKAALSAIATDGPYTINWTEPRYTITPFSTAGRAYKVRAGQALSFTFAKTGGETNSAAVWSISNNPSWLSINSGTGALTGTAPAINNSVNNVSYDQNHILGTNVAKYDCFDSLAPLLVSCKNGFGEAVNGPLPLQVKVVSPWTSTVSSATTMTSTARGAALTTYTITGTTPGSTPSGGPSSAPVSYVAYGLEQLAGTVALNPSTGAITGTVGASIATGTYTVYVAVVNAYGEGEDKAVTIVIT